jgi:hypothetical protein
MRTIARYVRAFFLALKLTLHGESLALTPQQALLAWTRRTIELVDRVVSAADSQGMDKPARQAFTLHIDKRDVSLEMALAVVRHHAAEEYPYLLQNPTPHHLTALQASNLNDGYWLAQFQEAEGLAGTPVGAALSALKTHLEAIPIAAESDT